MNRSTVNLTDLPDEMIVTIWNKLNKLDVLYSFLGVNQKFDRIVRDVVYTRSVELINNHSKNDNYSLPNPIVDRFCFHILPQIHQNIEHFILEPSSMGRILQAAEYPHLWKLTLIKFDQESALRYITDDPPFVHLFKKQISHLVVSINYTEFTSSSLIDLNRNIYARIFSTFTSLIDLDFGPTGSLRRHPRLSIYNSPSMTCFSSSINNLRVNVDTLDDCLCLLDGRLVNLHTLYVRIHNIEASISDIDRTILINLKCFSLTSCCHIKVYDSHIVPFLHRMRWLEQLMLRLKVGQRSTFIDGTHLNNEILIHMPVLQKFSFNIITDIEVIDEINRQSNDDLRRTFLNEKFPQVACYIDYYWRKMARSHIYSLPYTMNEMFQITNSFPGGFFPNVRDLFLMDFLHPFEHDFFDRITQAFPLLNYLTVFNKQPQKYTRTNRSNQDSSVSSSVEFPYLTHLTFVHQHIDYIEQFLVETNTRLPRLIELNIPYEQLEIVTENFTRDATRQNCKQLERIKFCRSIVHSKNFYLYFPNHK